MSALLPLVYSSAYAIAPTGFSDRLVAAGLKLPTAMEFAPDGRLFVSEKDGMVRVVKDGALLSTPFATLSVNSEGERGLQGIAFDPNFASNHYLYVYYTTGSEPVHNRVSRLTADPSNPDRMLEGSELPILDLESLVTVSHNGGALGFGPDGKLYVSTGDNYYPHLAQSLTSRFGKILRINPDGTIPSDNPFYNIEGAYREIWAVGLRNPFTFAFSPSSEGKMYINDVGQDSWEEINQGYARANYGWPSCEGSCPDPVFADPVSYYAHPSDGSGSSIAGGAFYTGSQFPSEYRGSYFFGDYAAGFIKRLTPDDQISDFLTNINSPVDVAVGPADGNLYYLSIGAGEVRKVQYTTSGNYDPVAVLSANQTSGLPPFTAGFDASGSTDQNSADSLSYMWDFGDGSSATGIRAAHTYNETGPYVATLTVSDSHGGVSSQTADIEVGSPPVGTIQTPPAGARYNAGDTISFSGSATDAQDGTASMPASAFHWKIDFQHNTHVHPFQEFDGVTSGSFTIPTVGETDDDVWYRIYLTVTDPSGLTQTSTRDILPNKSTVTLGSNVTGMELLLDGQPRVTPYSFVGVVGAQRTLGAPDTQVLGGQTYNFRSWADNSDDQNRLLVIPASDTAALTAYYSAGSPAPRHTITVRSADIAGNARTGSYTTVESLDGQVLGSGYTPINFTGYGSTKYTVIIRDYTSSTFDHWDDGSTSRQRVMTIGNDTTLTGYFRTLGTTTLPANDTPVAPPTNTPPQRFNLTVSSADMTGNARTGHYTTIESVQDSNIVSSGPTPLTYTDGAASQSYRATSQDIGNIVFDHWDDGSTNRTRTMTLSSNTILTAFYKNITQTSPPPAPNNDAAGTNNTSNASGSGSGAGGGGSGAGGGGNSGVGASGGGGAPAGPSPTAGPASETMLPDSYFVANPLAKVQLQSSNFVNSIGRTDLTQTESGEQVTLTTSFKNYQDSEQNYTLIIQTLDADESITADISLVTGKLAPGESATATLPWTADEQGSYLVKIFVWDNVNQSPKPLSEAMSKNVVVT